MSTEQATDASKWSVLLRISSSRANGWITLLFYYKYYVMNTSSSLFADLLRELSLAFANDQAVPFRTVHRSRLQVKTGCADLRMSQQITLLITLWFT